MNNQRLIHYSKSQLNKGGAMKKAFLFITIIIFTCLLFTGCEKRKRAIEDSKYIDYISEYTSGTISNRSSIQIRLAQAVDLSNRTIATENRKVADNIFKIDPKINGEIIWEDERTIVLQPAGLLPSGESYGATLNLKDIYPDVPESLQTFEFSFRVITQDFEVIIDEVVFDEKDQKKIQKVIGLVETADWVDNNALEKVLAAQYENRDLSITWDHSIGENKHNFFLSDLEREKESYAILLSWNGSAIDVNKKGSMNVDVYGLEDFRYLSYKLYQEPELYLNIQFSMPLDEKQNVKGLIEVKGDKDPRFLIEKNRVRLYPSGKHENTVQVIIDKALKDTAGTQLGEVVEFYVTFRQEHPQVRWVSKNGGILPSTDGLILPFEAISLKAVDVFVVEVYEDNIIQFLQVNRDVEGKEELKRVGRPVIVKTISLEKTDVRNLYVWNRFNLNLADVVELKPGSLYQVRINFRRSQSLYSCADSEELLELDEIPKEDWDSPREESYWDYWGEDYYYGSREDREDPCKKAYYGRRREISMNILASDLGIIAKGSDTGELRVFTADITDTQPISGVEVEVYNFQQQQITKGKTDGNGFISFQLNQVPFAIIAKRNKERGYLRVDDATALSMSNFDVGGTDSKKGIKGFLYGERGVWRPGDTMYLNFILEDKQNVLPEHHPIIFELRNPQDQLEERIVKTENVGGIYNFTIATDQQAPTGNWEALVRVGGQLFRKKIKVETIKPNRLKINLDFGKEVITAQDSDLKGNLDVKWLHGAVAKNLKAEFDLILTPITTGFKGYPNYSFDDPSREFSSESENVFSGRLDENGKASFDLRISAEEKAPGALRAIFTGKVYEEGGDFSIDKLTIPYYPYTSFVGMKLPSGDVSRGMLLTDKDHVVDIVSVDSYGNPISRRGIEIEVYKLDWKWWWDKSRENLANYISRNYHKRIIKDKVDTKEGKGQWKLRINYPSWGRYLIRVYDPVSKHAAGKIFYIDWPGWAGTAAKGELGGANILSFYADKEEYTVGENVKVTIPASAAGNALISVEGGSKVLDSFWLTTQEGKTEFDFKTTPKMSPNVFIHVTLLQPHAQVKNDLPIRLYGVVPIRVIDPTTRLEPQVSLNEVLAPEKEVKLTIQEKNGRAMAYTVAVVDEGLLDLTNFDTPDPWNSFYSKEALGIKTWDIYDDVIGALGENFGPLLAIGGGDELLPPKAQKASRFEPVVKFFGPFFLEKGKQKTHSFLMPRYVGSVKTMVVAAHNGAYGSTGAVSAVKESLMVLGTMPRVLGPGENIKLPVNVFVLEDTIQDVNVSVKTEGLLQTAGEHNKQLSFAKAEDKIVYFDLKTPDKLGIGKVFIVAQSGSEKASYEVEIDVRPSNPLETETYQALIEPNEKWNQQIELVGMEGTNKQYLEVSYLPPLNLNKRLNFLIRYPHGCVEQTVSAVFPQLYLSRLVDLTPGQQKEVEENIEGGINRIKQFRTSNGGFAYWPGGQDSAPWASNYAGHFLIEADNAGYAVPYDMLQQWAKYQKAMANDWRRHMNTYDNDLVQAYRLYTLALHGEPALGAMNRLKEQADIDFRAKWRLAAAYAIIGKHEIAEKIITRLPTKVDEYRPTGITYGSSLRDRAMILETLTLMKKREQAFQILTDVAQKLSTDKWYSTQTTAYSLLAVAQYGTPSQSEVLNCQYTFGSDAGSLNSEKSYIFKEFKPVAGSLTVENVGREPMYVRFISQGIPTVGKEKEDENIIKMSVRYKTRDGERVDDISRLKQGTNIVVETTVYNTGILGNLEELALTQIFPSGWEILNTRLQDIEIYSNADTPEYQDIRDDRVLTYFDLKTNESKVFRVLINAAYLGDFYMPGIHCEAMYDNAVFSRKMGKHVSVIQ